MFGARRLRDDKVASQLSPSDKAAVEQAVDEALKWLDANQLAEVEELEHKQRELEGVCSPIIMRMYQQGSGGGGAAAGGAGGAAPRGAGPTVEEVD